MAEALKQLGFEVTRLLDAGQQQMEDAIEALGRALGQGGVGLFYYAGHGLQVAGENYLIPIGARIDGERDARYRAVNANWVLDVLQDAGNAFNLVILDACRNNPFGRRWRGRLPGLAAPSRPATGALIAYATAPGAVADDGSGRNGLYTKHLLRYMKQPGLGVEEMFKRVRVAVAQASSGRQTPWESSSLTGDFFFAEGPAQSPMTSEAMQRPEVSANLELEFWRSVKGSTNPEDFEAYLSRYPQGEFVPLARNRLATLREADKERRRAEQARRAEQRRQAEQQRQREEAREREAAEWFNRGLRYYNGDGVRQSDAEAVERFRKAAAQGDAWARERLAEMGR